MKYEQYEIGDMVRFMDMKAHIQRREFFPAVGTIGQIVGIDKKINLLDIQWKHGSTSRCDKWFCDMKQVRRCKK